MHRLAGLPADITPHVLRHSYASLAADLGLADATIAALLGHKGHSVTRRYIHAADAALLAAADAGPVVVDVGGWAAPVGIPLVADRLSALMLTVSAGVMLCVLLYSMGQGVAGEGGVDPDSRAAEIVPVAI